MNVAETNFRQISLLAVLATGGKPRLENPWIEKLWLDQEELPLLFTQLIQDAEDDGEAVADFFSILNDIEPENTESWHGEWKSHGDACRASAGAAFTDLYFQTARADWLKASAYYKAAGMFLSDDDARKSTLKADIEGCSRLYLESMTPAGEIVDIVCDDGLSVRGYFLKAAQSTARSAAVICFGGPGETSDELLAKMSRHAIADGLSILMVELPPRRNRHVELSVGACVDYLIARGDIAEDRIALFGNNLGSVDASRAASLDPRFAAVICDGGIWEENRAPRLLDWASDGSGRNPDQRNKRQPRYVLARRFTCPFLVISGEYDFLDEQDVVALHAHAKDFTAPMTLKLFAADQSAMPRRKFIFEWISGKLAAVASPAYAKSGKSLGNCQI